MFGIRLMFLLAVMGGIIAFIADKMGSKSNGRYHCLYCR